MAWEFKGIVLDILFVDRRCDQRVYLPAQQVIRSAFKRKESVFTAHLVTLAHVYLDVLFPAVDHVGAFVVRLRCLGNNVEVKIVHVNRTAVERGHLGMAV